MKKVLFVITKSNFGGAQRYVYDLAINLPKERFEVSVALGSTGEKGASTGKLRALLKEAGIKTIVVKSFMRELSLPRETRALLELSRIIKEERPDILHVNSSKAGGLGAFIGRVVGVERIVFTVHGWPFGEDRGFLFALLLKMTSWLTVLLSHSTILVSNYDREKASWMPFVQKRFTVIHNGLEHIDFIPRDKARSYLETHSGADLPHASAWIGTISELHKNKGLSYAVKACSMLKHKGIDFIFLIIGSGEEQKNVERIIAEENLTDRVFLLGFVPDAQVYLKALDIFTLTSIKEGLPYVLIEAGRATLPVVASRIGGIPEIIEHESSGVLVEPRDGNAIANTLQTLIRDKQKRHEFGTTLKQKVVENFTFDHMVQQTLQVYGST